ncbi:MAG TPA: DUF6328 family protein [Mycobacteriales bacterium]|nr:DUF6328 family protein [Mycobacteriales bacterium]
MESTPPARAPDRTETPAERADRNWNELLQELRVTQTGVAILFSVLLTVPFSQRFEGLDAFGERVYLGALLLAAAAVVALTGPVAYHRLLFARGVKTQIVRVSHRMAQAGLVLLGLAVAAVLLLVCDLLVPRSLALTIAAAFGGGP